MIRREPIAATTLSFAQLLLHPLRGPAALLTLGCAIGLYLPLSLFAWSRAYPEFRLIVLLFVPLTIATALGVLQLHAWTTLRHLAQGHTQSIRHIAAEHISPWQNPHAARAALLVTLFVGLVAALFARSAVGGVVFGGVVAAALPAMLGVIVLEERVFDGLRPRHLWQFVTGLGLAYLPFALAMAVGTFALGAACLITEVLSLPLLLAASYCFVLGHASAGRLLYLRRNALGLVTIDGATPMDFASGQVEAQLDDLMIELHRLCRADRLLPAVLRLEAFLRDTEYSLDEHVHQRLQRFLDQRLLVGHAAHYAARLVAADRPLSAWLVLRTAFDVDARFRPTALDVLLVAIAQAPPQDAPRVIEVLGDAEFVYTGHPLLPNSLFLLARCHAEQFGNVDDALTLLTRIEQEYPQFAEHTEFRTTSTKLRRLRAR